MQNPVTYRIQRLREQARKAAKVRWDRERSRRNRLDEIDPVRVGGRIVERIVVIRDECRVRERTIYEHDRPCDILRKRKEVFA